MLIILFTILITIISSFLYVQHKRKEPEKILGVYSQSGKWYFLKYIFILTVLVLRKIKITYFTSKNVKDDGITTRNVEFLESLQPLSNDENATDAVFFQGVSQDGYAICGGLERRHEGKANGLFYIVVPGIGLLKNEQLPKTLLNADPASIYILKEYSAGGIRFTPVEPMKKWKVSFEGNMKSATNKKHSVKLEAEWTSNLPFFLFDTDMSCRALARGIAREKWSKKYFETLKASHQTHYEQIGKLNGTLKIDDEERAIKMTSFRDHSFAYKRDWNLMHRYSFNMLFLENGLTAVVGIVSQPCTTSQLEMGYVVQTNKEIHAIEFCNFELYQHGENGRPPINYGFTFIANGVIYDANIHIEHEDLHYKGLNDEAKLYELFAQVDINGIKGRGICEWHYNNK